MGLNLMRRETAPGEPGALLRLTERLSLSWFALELDGLTLELPEPSEAIEYIQDRMQSARGGDDPLPFWTRLWPASMALCRTVAALDPETAGPVLELGAGLGAPGLVAALRGMRTVLTDLDPDALEFARAAVEKNGLGGMAEVRLLDWSDPPGDMGRFNTVLAAEVLYQPRFHAGLTAILRRMVAPGGRALIAQQEGPRVRGFMEMVEPYFEIRARSGAMRGEDGPVKVFLYSLKSKE